MAKACLDLTLPELQSLANERAVVFIPVGWTESRGPHLGFGFGSHLVEAMCHRLAASLETEGGLRAILMPTLPFALDTADPGCAVHVRGHVMRDWIVDVVQGMGRLGFKNFICVSSMEGPRTITAIEEAAHLLARRGRVWGWTPKSKLRLLPLSSAQIKSADLKRSWLRFRPEASEMRTLTSAALALSQPSVRAFYQELPGLKEANAAEGAANMTAWIDHALPIARSFLAGSNRWPRSRFGLFPWNWSFFKAWVLFTILAVIAWMSLAIFWQPMPL